MSVSDEGQDPRALLSFTPRKGARTKAIAGSCTTIHVNSGKVSRGKLPSSLKHIRGYRGLARRVPLQSHPLGSTRYIASHRCCSFHTLNITE